MSKAWFRTKSKSISSLSS